MAPAMMPRDKAAPKVKSVEAVEAAGCFARPLAARNKRPTHRGERAQKEPCHRPARPHIHKADVSGVERGSARGTWGTHSPRQKQRTQIGALRRECSARIERGARRFSDCFRIADFWKAAATGALAFVQPARRRLLSEFL